MTVTRRLPRSLTTALPENLSKSQKLDLLKKRAKLASAFAGKPMPLLRKEVIAQLAIRGRLGASSPYRKMSELIEMSKSNSPYKGVAGALVKLWNWFRNERVDVMVRDHQVLVTLTNKLRKIHTSTRSVKFKLNKSEKRVLSSYLSKMPAKLKIEFEALIESE